MLAEYVFDSTFAPLMICIMQGSVAVLTEVLNLFLLTGQTDILATITGYIAVLIISQIDDTFLLAISDSTVVKVKSAEDYKPKYVQGTINIKERETGNKILFILLKIVKTLYNSMFFYFFPFLVILMNFVSQSCETAPNPGFKPDGSLDSSTVCDPVYVWYWRDVFTLPLISLKTA